MNKKYYKEISKAITIKIKIKKYAKRSYRLKKFSERSKKFFTGNKNNSLTFFP